MIHTYSSDTDMTPFDVGAYASSTTYLTGQAVIKAATEARKQIEGVAAAMMGCDTEELVIDKGVCSGPGDKKVTFAEVAIQSLYVKDQQQIQATASHITHKSPPPFSAHFAEVEVDTETGVVKVVRYVAAVDCGTAINPALAEGQTQGGVLNGISYALCEQYHFDGRGRVLNPDFNHYKTYGAADMPEIKAILVPTWEPTGPFGAKSVSEICINGPVPAIANAIYDAVGIRLTTSPFTPEAVLKALGKL